MDRIVRNMQISLSKGNPVHSILLDQLTEPGHSSKLSLTGAESRVDVSLRNMCYFFL